MKTIRAYLVINTCIKNECHEKVAGVFWKKRNAKNFAWQLNTESADSKSGDLFIVEKYRFVPNRSASYLSANTDVRELLS